MPAASLPAAKRLPSQRNTTADRAIDVLLLFDEQNPVLSAVEIGKRLELSRSTVYRYLQTLRSYALIEEVDRRDGFRLGSRIFQLARIARQGMGLIEVALPIMERLAEETGEAVLLTRRAGSLVTCIERVESSHPIRLSYERGQALPIHAGASAKLLLAFEEPSEIATVLKNMRFERFTDTTVTDLPTFRASLKQIREQGYAVSLGELDEGVCGVAAPIFTPAGKVAGISVAGPAFRMGSRERPRIIAAVRKAADEITVRLAEIEGAAPPRSLSNR